MLFSFKAIKGLMFKITHDRLLILTFLLSSFCGSSVLIEYNWWMDGKALCAVVVVLYIDDIKYYLITVII